MSLSVHSLAVDTFVPLLRDLSGFLAKGVQHATTQGSSSSALLAARLAPDMFPLDRQVFFACLQARQAIARLRGQDPPTLENKERSLDELQTLVAETIAQVQALPAADLENAASREVAFPLGPELFVGMTGLQYLQLWILPNFYFHLVTAYGILRAQGVPLGKADYMAHTASFFRPPPTR